VKERGFTYVMVLAAIVIVGVLIGVARATTWRSLQVDREAELLFRGKAYRKAIEGFYQSNGGYPRSLEDLLLAEVRKAGGGAPVPDTSGKELP